MRNDASVLHLDADAFFASVEQRQKPSLKGRPVVVGGTGPRGVVATASYEARAFGVHSAMPGGQARVLCPGAVFLTGRFEAYRQHSAVIMETLRELSPLVEPVSLDEAFVDLAAGPFGADPAAAADWARRTIYNLTGLFVSVGLGRSKLVAKLASDAEKPHGFTVVEPDREDAFLLEQPVSALWGVGPATQANLEALGVHTVAELRAVDLERLVAAVGLAHGHGLYRLARGIDTRPVVPAREAKSVGAEHTFDIDRVPGQLPGELEKVFARAMSRLDRHGGGARTVTVKVRVADFTTVSRSVSLPQASVDRDELWDAARRALGAAAIVDDVRLLGVAFSGLSSHTQPALVTLETSTPTAPAGPVLEGSDDPDDDTDVSDSPSDGDDGSTRPGQPVTAESARAGLDASHPRFGRGWLVRPVEDEVVTVRFETASTGPGRQVRFPVGEPGLVHEAPEPPVAVTDPVSLPPMLPS